MLTRIPANAEVVFVTIIRQVVLDGGNGGITDVDHGRGDRAVSGNELAVTDLDVDQQPFSVARDGHRTQAPRETRAPLLGHDGFVAGELVGYIGMDDDLMLEHGCVFGCWLTGMLR